MSASSPAPEVIPDSVEPSPSAFHEGIAAVCGILVIVLELPAFWISIALGMSLSDLVWVEPSWQGIRAAFAPRAIAYAQVIVPVLAISAAAEAIAIKGLGSPARAD
jgi:hypothetical protein